MSMKGFWEAAMFMCGIALFMAGIIAAGLYAEGRERVKHFGEFQAEAIENDAGYFITTEDGQQVFRWGKKPDGK